MKRLAMAMAMVLLAGCGTGGVGAKVAAETLRALLPIAAEMMKGQAKKQGVNLDEINAICYEPPAEVLEDIPFALVMCIAPKLEVVDE